MERSHRYARRVAFAAATAALVGATLTSSTAHADDTIKRPGDHPQYPVEIEPHFILGGWDNLYPGTGYGVGVRFSIPIVDRGFVPNINDTVAISFGVDFLHYGDCYYYSSCNANYLQLPVVLQWNFYVAQKWSVFGEPGLYIYHGFYDDCPPGDFCSGEHRTGVEPAFYVGGRYHFNDHVTLTMRAGFPTISVGVSFM